MYQTKGQDQPSGSKYSKSPSPYRENENNNSIVDDEQQINQILRTLKSRYLNLDNLIADKEEEKQQIIDDVSILNKRLMALEKSIQKKKIQYEKYDKTLKDAESAFTKITDSTKSLLQIVKSNMGEIQRKSK